MADCIYPSARELACVAIGHLFSFGVIADLHFMDADDGRNFDGTKIRRFRQSLEMLFRASDSFIQNHTACNILLGDILDGKAKTMGKETQFLDEILDVTLRTDRNWFAVLGNHEYYNFDREKILCSLIPASVRPYCSPSKLYYSFSPHPGYRFIILDGYELSVMGGICPEMSQQADALVRAKNHNYAAGSNHWFKDLSMENLRYVPFNGGICQAQMDWLGRKLNAAVEKGEKCVVFCHMALCVRASHEQNLLWNCEDVLDILHQTPRGTVLACIAGHDHNGGYAFDDHGIHHIVPPAPIECDEGEDSFGTVQVYKDKLVLLWTGKRPTSDWPEMLPLIA